MHIRINKNFLSRSILAIKHTVHFAISFISVTKSYSSLDSSVTIIGSAQESLASSSAIIKAVNSPLYAHLGRNFDSVLESLEEAKEIITSWYNLLSQLNPEVLLIEFNRFLTATGNTRQGLSAQALTKVLFCEPSASNVPTNIESLYIVYNYELAGLNLANFVNLKTVAFFDGVITNALRTAIQNLEKSHNKLVRIIISRWGGPLDAGAFENATSLVDLWGFTDVTILGASCFCGCSAFRTLGANLNEVNLNATDIRERVFQDCSSLTKVTMPNLTYLPANAFRDCTALTYVNCPLVQNLGEGVFRNCSALSTLHINFPTITAIPDYAFQCCRSLYELDFPLVATIGIHSFWGCSNLLSVTCPVITIGDAAFRHCRAMFDVPSYSIEEIGYEAFYDCTSLEFLWLPSLRSAGNAAFAYCNRLYGISLDVLTSMGASAFYSCQQLEAFDAPELIEIRNTSFFNCPCLCGIFCPHVEKIGDQAFSGCSSLDTVELGNLQYVAPNAFEGTPIEGNFS